MKKPHLALLLASLGTGVLFAQTPPVASPSRESAVELSPFVVNAEADTGYGSSETLSGTRLRTSVKDVASAMTIITPELMADLGATTYSDIADFLPSTASYASFEEDQYNNGTRTGTPFIVRGYRSDSLSSNFFTTYTEIDSYNTSRFTFSRGPNSILFSVGNPGGSLDVTTNRASVNKPSAKLGVRFDSNDSYRYTLDANYMLVPKKLGVRVDLLHEDRKLNLKPSKARRDSFFLTTTYQPTPSTTIYSNLELNRIRRQVPRNVEFFDWYNTWADAGRPVIATAKKTTPVNGVEFNSSSSRYVDIAGIGLMNWSKMGYGARPLVAGVRESQLSYGQHSPNQVVPLDTYIIGDGDHVNYDTQIYTAVVQQRLGGGFNLEIGGQFEHDFRENFESGGAEDVIYVDPNARLPDGSPNPNVGLPYVETSPRKVQIGTNESQARATLSYEKDLNGIRLFGRGLGKLSVAGLYGIDVFHQYLDAYRRVNTSGTGSLTGTANFIWNRHYFKPGNANYLQSDFPLKTENGITVDWGNTGPPRNNTTRLESLSLAVQADLLDNLLVLTAGLRRDDAVVGQYNYGKDPRGLYEGARGNTLSSPAPDIETVGRPYLYGAVLNVHPNFSLFYNRSTNFQPDNQSFRKIDDTPLPPLEGRGYDTGVKFTFLDNRITGSIDYFTTEQNNVRDNSIRGKKVAWISAIWDAIDPDQNPAGTWADTKTSKTDGIEIQVVANPTKNLRLMTTVSRNINVLEAHGATTFGYLDANYAAWEAQAATPVSSNDGATVGDLVARIKQEVSDDQQIVGIRQTRVYKWQFNLVGRYQFDQSSPLKGFAIGSAYRWRQAPVIGYAITNGLLDTNRPFYGSTSDNLDSWIEYKHPLSIGGRKLQWKAELRVQNVLDDRRLLPWTAKDDGTGNARIINRRTPGARQYTLSSTLVF